LVEIREGDALQTLARDLPDTIDFGLLDGAPHWLRIAYAVVHSLSPTTRMRVPNILRVRSAVDGYLSVAFADDVELSMRLGLPHLATELRRRLQGGL
jgi:hypothetical protein